SVRRWCRRRLGHTHAGACAVGNTDTALWLASRAAIFRFLTPKTSGCRPAIRGHWYWPAMGLPRPIPKRSGKQRKNWSPRVSCSKKTWSALWQSQVTGAARATTCGSEKGKLGFAKKEEL